MKSTRSPTEFDQNNSDVTSLPGCATDMKNTGAILQISQGGTPMKITGSHCLTSDGENITSYFTTGSPWRSTSTRLRELKKLRLRIFGFSQQIQEEDLSKHSINDPTLLKRKENANDCMTSTWQEPNKKTQILRSQQMRQNKGQQFEGHEELDCAANPKTG